MVTLEAVKKTLKCFWILMLLSIKSFGYRHKIEALKNKVKGES